MKTRITLIDGNSFLFRAFYGIRANLTRKDGTPINAVYGLCSMLINLLEKALPNEEFYMVFDANKKNFRHQIYPEYKANRSETPAELIPQFPLSRLATDAFNIPILEIPGYEADDVIATIASTCFLDKEVRIVSSDKDLMQLINGCCYLYDSMKSQNIYEEQCLIKFGVNPNKVIYVQALMGDSVDNIPGAKGIGPKTASELINQFGDIDNLYRNIDKVKPESRKQKLIESKDNVYMSLQLVELKKDVPLPELKNFKSVDLDRLNQFFITELNSQHLVDLANKAFKNATILTMDKDKQTNKLITTKQELDNFINNALNSPILVFNPIYNSLDLELIGISISSNIQNSYYIPIKCNDNNLLNKNDILELDLNTIKQKLSPLFKNDKIIKVGYNWKQMFHILQNMNINISNKKGYEDIMLMSYLLNSMTINNDLVSIVDKYLPNINLSQYRLLTNKKFNFDNFNNNLSEIDINEICNITRDIFNLFTILNQDLKQQENLYKLYKTCDLPLIRVLYEMETSGVLIDSKALINLSTDLHKKRQDLEQIIYNISGEFFNLASPSQLGKILFEKLQIPYNLKKTKTGNYQTDSTILEELYDNHQIIPYILEWRMLNKLITTYTDALPGYINKKTGRVHTTYLQTSTNTGRLSSRDPNLQNIPIKTKYGEEIRKMFIASNNHKLIIADYSQIQLRLLAHIANIESMKSVFNMNKDIHLLTASQIFNKPEAEISSIERRIAKTTNFSIVYGVSSFGLANQLGISPKDAKQIIEKYYNAYPGIKTYMESVKSFALSHGYVLTPWGRRIDLPEIMNSKTRQYALRAAINAPIQGFEADLMRLATIQIFNKLQISYNNDAKIIMQIHDELVLEVTMDIAEKCAQIVKDTMENITKLTIPLVANTIISDKWDK